MIAAAYASLAVVVSGVGLIASLLRGLAHALAYVVLTLLGLPFLGALALTWWCLPEAL